MHSRLAIKPSVAGWHRRQVGAAAAGAGYRNGYRGGRLRTAEGAIEYGVPGRGSAEPFVCRVQAGLAGRTAELERLAAK